MEDDWNSEMSRWFRSVVLSGTQKTLRRKGTMGNHVGGSRTCILLWPSRPQKLFFFAFLRCRPFFLSHLRGRCSGNREFCIAHFIALCIYNTGPYKYLHLYRECIFTSAILLDYNVLQIGEEYYVILH